jgi:hypothetical protein
VRIAYLLFITVVVAAGTGCVDGFRGSNVQIDLSAATPSQAAAGQTPRPEQLPTNVHFKLYAIDEEVQDSGATIERLFELQRFEITTLVNLTSPCFIDTSTNARFPGLHVTQYRKKIEEVTGITDVANPPPGKSESELVEAATAIQRMSNIGALGGDMGIKVVTSASTEAYPAVDADCTGSGLPPPSCIDDATNGRRLAQCQTFWGNNPDFYEGTDRVLTAPLNGELFGFVVGMNPINLAPVGGAQFFVPYSLDGVEEYAVFYQTDGMDTPGTLLLSGRPTVVTRGVDHVDMTSPTSPNITANMAVFADLGEDDVQF